MYVYVVIKIIVSITKISCYIASKDSQIIGVFCLQGFTIDCRCTHSISPFYIIIM